MNSIVKKHKAQEDKGHLFILSIKPNLVDLDIDKQFLAKDATLLDLDKEIGKIENITRGLVN